MALSRLAADDSDAAGAGMCRQSQADAAADAQDGDCGTRAEAAHQQASARAPIFPYLLRGLAIERSNQVWCADITYIPIGRGFLYLVAIMDWASRAVLAWRLSNTMDSSFCVAALQEALARFGTPDIFNTDQGGQFTSADFTGVLMAASVRISMDGRGRWMDNDGCGAHSGITAWFAFTIPPTSGARPAHANGGVAPRRHRWIHRHGCGHELGRRSRVAHMPAAAAATAATCSLMC
jgi:hypothetical protein